MSGEVDLLPGLLFLCLYLSCFYFHGRLREGLENLCFRLGTKVEVFGKPFSWYYWLFSERKRHRGSFSPLRHGWGWCWGCGWRSLKTDSFMAVLIFSYEMGLQCPSQQPVNHAWLTGSCFWNSQIAWIPTAFLAFRSDAAVSVHTSFCVLTGWLLPQSLFMENNGHMELEHSSVWLIKQEVSRKHRETKDRTGKVIHQPRL